MRSVAPVDREARASTQSVTPSVITKRADRRPALQDSWQASDDACGTRRQEKPEAIQKAEALVSFTKELDEGQLSNMLGRHRTTNAAPEDKRSPSQYTKQNPQGHLKKSWPKASSPKYWASIG